MARKAFPGFDNMPEEAQRAILDMGYNLGITNKGVSKFPNMSKHMKAGNFAAAARESNRPRLGKPRNKHVYDLFMKADQAVRKQNKPKP